MPLGIGIGNAILFINNIGRSAIPGLIVDLCARATYCENKICTTETLNELEIID